MSANKIFITGASGVGKTYLANWIAQEYDIPFISTSAKNVWKIMGFRNHAHAHRMSCYNKATGLQYQSKVLDDRVKALVGLESFITDRSPIDNLAYILMQIGYSLSDLEMSTYVNLCSQASRLGNKLIFIRYSDDIILENDGSRITNIAYQRMTDAVIEMILNKTMIDHNLNMIILNGWDWETRKQIVEKWLNQ